MTTEHANSEVVSMELTDIEIAILCACRYKRACLYFSDIVWSRKSIQRAIASMLDRGLIRQTNRPYRVEGGFIPPFHRATEAGRMALLVFEVELMADDEEAGSD